MYRDNHISRVSHDHFELNRFHDELMRHVVELAISRTAEKLGPTPCPFSFFVMGSAGRMEQAIWSDQDNGIIFQNKNIETKTYFIQLGQEITNGLFEVGYTYCDGGVMASNDQWCKSLSEWEEQISEWIEESSWETIRNLLILIDGRHLYGENQFITTVKKAAYRSIHQEHLLARMLDNTMLLKKGVGLLGQFLTETHGPHSTLLNIKERALYPYVNALRLMAVKEKIEETSSLARLQKLPAEVMNSHEREVYEKQFLQLLYYRITYGDHSNYESGHYLVVSRLSRQEKKEMKSIIRNGPHLYQFVRKLIERDV
ncbi:MAG: DUF294 nucleotidyltransferase-like domain-containing protein [Bacillota bacterium]|nr:DUF294 nucleotidyltransferase-like domain-containing protein [Bacillota bacterium]